MNLPPSLSSWEQRIRASAKAHGLVCFDTIFEMVDEEQLDEIAAYGGFPTRYPHWRHGMEFERLRKSSRWGISKIYELVINNDPCYAYLLSSNSLTDNKLVMAHVFGHCDFFKNNAWFRHSERKMMDRMANHAVKVRRCIDRHGVEAVEAFLDRALSLENLLDYRQLCAGTPLLRPQPRHGVDEDEVPADAPNFRLRSRDYMDEFINPPEYMEQRRRKHAAEQEEEKRLPGGPRRDLLALLLEHAPLARWEWDLLNIVHEEALYFAPQRVTKIMNEGWASYWHRKLMVDDVLTDDEVVDYADTVAGTLAEGQSLNPYKLGLELFLDIEARWNSGRHGKDFEACDDMAQRDAWEKAEGRGLEQIFFARAVHDDVTFLDAYLTEDFCHRHKLFVYRRDPRTHKKELVTREFAKVKEELLTNIVNGGAPVIEAVDLNHSNRGELLLAHRHMGKDLRPDFAEATLLNLAAIWKRPVVLESRIEDKLVRWIAAKGTVSMEHPSG
ncbi:MAG: SpoVR family protein [Planctomycetes bacterium]|nr:SpoVR family protein [Planctomycetota bacterium]